MKIMKIPLQPGAAQQAEAALASTWESLWRLASHLAAVVAEYRQRAIMINSYSFYICKKNLSGTSAISLPVDAVRRETDI